MTPMGGGQVCYLIAVAGSVTALSWERYPLIQLVLFLAVLYFIREAQRLYGLVHLR